MQQRHLAIFDFDGTVADSMEWFFNGLNEAARRHGFREISRSDRELLRGQTSRQVLSFLGLPDRKLPLVARTLRSIAARDIDQIRPFPWVSELFRDLTRHNTRIAIVSSNSEANIRQVLGADIVSCVSHFAAGASLFGKASKFRSVIRKCGPLTGRKAAIGDEIRDIEAARKVGIDSLAVTWGAAAAPELRLASPSRLIEDPKDVLDWFSS